MSGRSYDLTRATDDEPVSLRVGRTSPRQEHADRPDGTVEKAKADPPTEAEVLLSVPERPAVVARDELRP